MKESKKAVLEILKKEHPKDLRFESLVLNLALQKMDSDSFEYDGKAVFSSNKSCLVYCMVNEEEFKIPAGVKIIGEMAFRQKKHLKSITISPTVEVIERDAFYDCDDLDNVVIPASVDTVRSYAFAECDKLKKVVFEGLPKHLSRHCFDDCDDLHSIIVPAGTARKFRKALHLNDDDMDFIVVEDPSNTKFLSTDTKTKKGKKGKEKPVATAENLETDSKEGKKSKKQTKKSTSNKQFATPVKVVTGMGATVDEKKHDNN